MAGILEDIYSQLPDGADAPASDRHAVDAAAGSGAATYGEITVEAARRLLRWLNLGTDDTFVDCGSGTGRMVLQAALETEVGRAVGIELSAFRHDVAERALEEVRSQCGPSVADRVEFYEGDFREQMPDGFTVIYAGSLCFPESLMGELADQCRRARAFRILCTLKPLPARFLATFEERGGLDLDMSWSTGNRVLIYGPRRR